MRLFFTSGTASASRATVTVGPGCASFKPVFRSRGRREIGNEYAVPDRHRPVFGLHVVDIENRVVVGELVFEDARLDIGRQLRGRHACCGFWYSAWMARGFSQTAHAPETSMAANAKVKTGATTIRVETPPDRMAIISLSLERRPRPTRMPTSTPNGMLSSRMGGSESANSSSDRRAFGRVDEEFEELRRSPAGR